MASNLDTRLSRLEQQAEAEIPAAPLRVVRRIYARDGSPLDPSPVPECDVLIRRQIVESDGNGSPAPGYVPIRERGRALAGPHPRGGLR